jgi:hypothetical protein
MACGCNEKWKSREYVESVAQRYSDATGEEVIIVQKDEYYNFEPVHQEIIGDYLKRVYPNGVEVFTRIKV